MLERFQKQYGADAVQFHDMDFFISEPRTLAIADRLERLGMTWWALGRVDELMRYRTTHLGRDEAQRAEDGVLRRRVRIDRHADAHEQRRHGRGGAHARSGAPHEVATASSPNSRSSSATRRIPKRDLRETLAFIRRIKRINPATEIILYVYSPVPTPAALDEAASDARGTQRRDPLRVSAARSTTG